MTFGRKGVEQARVHDLEDAGKMLELFKSHGHVEIDTARLYGSGSSEEYLGSLGWEARGFSMATKFIPLKPLQVMEVPANRG
jgi:aflatoxin B1 aldehyde reductase